MSHGTDLSHPKWRSLWPPPLLRKGSSLTRYTRLLCANLYINPSSDSTVCLDYLIQLLFLPKVTCCVLMFGSWLLKHIQIVLMGLCENSFDEATVQESVSKIASTSSYVRGFGVQIKTLFCHVAVYAIIGFAINASSSLFFSVLLHRNADVFTPKFKTSPGYVFSSSPSRSFKTRSTSRNETEKRV